MLRPALLKPEDFTGPCLWQPYETVRPGVPTLISVRRPRDGDPATHSRDHCSILDENFYFQKV